MDPSDSLQLDEHLARLLAAYDQDLAGGDAKAQTVSLPPPPASKPSPGNQGPLDELLPDSEGPPPRPSPPRPAATPAPGTPHRIGRFELRRQLGKGGCGIVFLAYDPKLQREVALKIPRPEMLMSLDARRRLVREARAAAEFDHPNLVPVYESGEIGPVCFIATAFCPGQTLSEWLDRQAFPVPVRQAARLVAQLAEAVQHAHDRGVLHRDLKPNNVILQRMKAAPDDQGPPPGACPLRGDHFLPRIVDFGLAKLAERDPSDTTSRQILGTPKYMAPEQAQARHHEVGPAADVYALGVILYELLAGRAPYDGATDVEVLRQAIEGNMTPPRDVRGEVPRDLEAICLKAMARSPGKRYRTAIDLADDLRRFLDGLPTLARPLNLVGRTGRWLRRNDQAVALAVVTVVAVVFFGIGAWNTYQTRRLRTDRDTALRERAERNRADLQRESARHVRDAFLSWRAGDAKQMSDSLEAAKTAANTAADHPGFAWGYLTQLGRVERFSARCPAGAVVALAVSADGARSATGHPDGTLAVWDRATGHPLGSVKAHPGEVTHVAFLGGSVVTAGGEPAPRAWHLGPDGVPRAAPALPALSGPVTCLAAAPDGSALFAGSAGGECLRWDPGRPGETRRWDAGGGEPVVSLAVAPDGRTVGSVARGGPVRLWDAATGEPRGEVRGSAGSAALAFCPAGVGGWLLAAGGNDDGTARLYDRGGRELRTLAGHADAVLTLAASPDGSFLASGGKDDCVCVWDVDTGSLRSLLRGHEKPVRAVRFGPDGRTLLTASEDGQWKSWDLTAEPEGPSVRGLPGPVSAVGVHADGGRIAVAYADGSVEVYQSRGAAPRRYPGDGRGRVSALRVPRAGPPVGVELAGRSVVVWEFGDAARPVFRVEPPDGAAATTAELSGEADRLAVGDDRGRVSVWSVADRTPAGTFGTQLDAPVRFLSISDDGTRVAAQTAGWVVGVWEVGSPDPKYRVYGHGDGLWLLRFAPDGTRVVTAGRGSSIRVWALAPSAAREEVSLLGHVGKVTGLAVSPDGRTLVSASNTGEVKLWDTRTGLELVGLRRHTGPVASAEFAGSGRLLVTAGTAPGGKGELVFWDAGKE